MKDVERIERNKQALIDAGLDGFVCSLPMNVLLLTGYWPVIGTSVAIFTRDGETCLLVPEDEADLAKNAWPDRVVTFSTGSLSELRSFSESVRQPLKALISDIGTKRRFALDDAPISEPVSYAAMSLTSRVVGDLLGELGYGPLADDRGALARLRSVLTDAEIANVRLACTVAESGFRFGCGRIEEGRTETKVANDFRGPLSTSVSSESVRSDGFTFCMSGENSYNAYASYQRSTDRRLESGDPVLVHCNSYINGFWTDITRTYSLLGLGEKRARIYEHIFSAVEAAMDAIRPGAKAREVDAAARTVLAEHGLGEEFKHGLGHGVGYHAIDHMAPPRLHPASEDVLETGMVFNIEPAVYSRSLGGIRQCNMVVVTDSGAEMLTPFQNSIHDLLIRGT